jgi:hypothetical protein
MRGHRTCRGAKSRRAALSIFRESFIEGEASRRSFRQFSLTAHDPHFIPFSVFLQQVSRVPGLPALPLRVRVIRFRGNPGSSGLVQRRYRRPWCCLRSGNRLSSLSDQARPANARIK